MKARRENTYPMDGRDTCSRRQGGSLSKTGNRGGSRFLTAFLLAALLLGVTGCGGDPQAEGSVLLTCTYLFFVTPPEDVHFFSNKTCLNTGGKSHSDRSLFGATTSPTAPGVTRTGEALLSLYAVDGRVEATEFPELIFDVPSTLR